MKKEILFCPLIAGFVLGAAWSPAAAKPAAKRAPLRRLVPNFPPAMMRAPLGLKPVGLKPMSPRAVVFKPQTIAVFHPETPPQEARKTAAGAPVSKVIHVQTPRVPLRVASPAPTPAPTPASSQAGKKNAAPMARVVVETASGEATLY